MTNPRVNTGKHTNPPCRFFAAKGCRNGENCRFSHAVPITSVSASECLIDQTLTMYASNLKAQSLSHITAASTQQTRSERSGPQVDHPNGEEWTPSGLPMPAAPDTTFNHHAVSSNSKNHRKISRRTLVCRAWKAGSCSKGLQCHFRHPPSVRRPLLLI